MDKMKSDFKGAMMKRGEKSFKASLREKFDPKRPKAPRDPDTTQERKHSAPEVPTYQKSSGPTILWKTITKVAAPDRPPKRPPPPVSRDYAAAAQVASSVATSKYAGQVKKEVMNDWSSWEKKNDPWDEIWDSGSHSNSTQPQPPPVKPRGVARVSTNTSKRESQTRVQSMNDLSSWEKKIDPWKDQFSSHGNNTKPPSPVKPRVGVPSTTGTSQSGRVQSQVDWSAWEKKIDPWKDHSESGSHGNRSQPPPVEPRFGVMSTTNTTPNFSEEHSKRLEDNLNAWVNPEPRKEQWDSGYHGDGPKVDSSYHGDGPKVDECFTPVTEVDWSTVADDASGPAGVYVRCVHSYQAQQDSDLSINVGDVIEVLKATDKWDDWWEGRMNDHVGIFPANHTEVIE